MRVGTGDRPAVSVDVKRNEARLHAPLVLERLAAVTNSSDAISAAKVRSYYGKVVFLTHADAVAVTLPDPGFLEKAGTQVIFVLNGDNSLAVTFAPTTADTLVAPNNATADSVTFAAGQRIGAVVMFLSDGSKWHALSIGGTTITVTDT